MRYLLHNFNARSENLKKALDGDVSLFLDPVSRILNLNPIDGDQQSLLEDVRMLKNSLKGTVLDGSEPDIQDTPGETDQGSQQFSFSSVKKEMNMETSRLEQGPEKGEREEKEAELIKPPDDVLLKGLGKKAGSVQSPGKTLSVNESQMLKGSQSKIRVKTGLARTEIPPAPSVAKLKTMVVEKNEIAKILQRQRGPDTVQARDKGQKEAVGVDSGGIKKERSPGISITREKIKGEKLPAPGFEIWFKKNVSKLKGMGGGVVQDMGGAILKDMEGAVEQGAHGGKPRIHKIIGSGSQKKQAKTYPTLSLNKILSEILHQTADLDTASSKIQTENRDSTPVTPSGIRSVKQGKAIPPIRSVKQGKSIPPTRAFAQFDQRLDQALNSYDHRKSRAWPPFAHQDQNTELSNSQILTSRNQISQIPSRPGQRAETKQKSMEGAIPEELQTAVQWMAEEEVENKLVELLSRQAKLRGVDLS